MSDIVVCRRVVDCPSLQQKEAQCESCKERVFVESGLEDRIPKLCIHCAVISHPNTVLFVELPPDEYGPRSISKGITEVYHAGGEWHKTGIWHNAKWVLDHQE